ncbi:MAG: hypothetical protein R2932_17280 [Caldilineaceae bacterium]
MTADHGNCERMIDLVTGKPHTYHTTQPVALLCLVMVTTICGHGAFLVDVTDSARSPRDCAAQGDDRASVIQ